MKFFSMAALALVGAVMTGCSSDDNIQQPANNDNAYILKTTISFDTDDVTNRALSVDFTNKKATKTFAEGDQIVLFYIDGKGISRRVVSSALTPGDITNEGKRANLTFDVSASLPATDGAIRYVYPANMASTNDNSNFDLDDEHTIDFSKLDNQDGTLTTLGRSLDLCVFEGNFSGTSLPTSVTLTNRLAILALTLKNSDGSSIITRDLEHVYVMGSWAYGVTPKEGVTFGNDVIYVAIRPEARDFGIDAPLSTSIYQKGLGDRTFVAGHFYNLPVRMELFPLPPLP